MMLKSKAPKTEQANAAKTQLANAGSKPRGLLRWLRFAVAGAAAAAGATGLTVGCLDRPVSPQDPVTSNVYVAEIRQTAVDKIDLLFMIDNSASMADKQEILGEAVPVLLRRLIQPVCVDATGNPLSGNADPMTGRCANGSPEFTPIKDIHIGVITSSLGAHGGNVSGCSDPVDNMPRSRGNDQAQLLGIIQPQLPNYKGFLAWDPDGTKNQPPVPAADRNAQTLIDNFRNMVLGAGENGCGYEAQLESWYRFLIDPAPPLTVPPTTGGFGIPVIPPPEQNPILQQRAAFLRPDSLVAIIMLTDENDCSMKDEGQGWYAATPNAPLPRSTSQCATNPNDPCCTLCGGPTPQGCSADPRNDPNCAVDGGFYATGSKDDAPNLRCYNQKQRFGIDLLYGVDRYIIGLTSPEVDARSIDGNGQVVLSKAPNPLLRGAVPRDNGLVFLAGIVGVPWQDVATADSWPENAPLKYLKFQDLGDRWNVILGKPEGATLGGPPILPTDRLMVETPVDRTTLFANDPHPLFPNDPAYSLKGPMSAANANRINGHEATIADNSDLQYACIFDLKESTTCEATSPACDCRPDDAKYNRPLCNGTTQNKAKAYPGVRELQVLKGYGDITKNSIVASICPKNVRSNNPEQDPSYGYNPAVAAIVDRLKEALRGKCLPRKLSVNETTGEVPCAVVEAAAPVGGACDCSAAGRGQGRTDAKPEIKPATYRLLAELGYCGKTDAGQPPCSDAGYCLCEINQFRDTQLTECLTAPQTSSNIYGYCYVDPASAADPNIQTAQEQIVASCPDNQKRLLRFAGENVPARGALALIACIGATTRDQPTAGM